MSNGGRFIRGKSRLIEREHVIHETKAINKRIGKVNPEENIKIPVIGEWSVGEINNNANKGKNERSQTSLKGVRLFPKNVPLTNDQVQRLLETPQIIEEEEPPPSRKNIIDAPYRLQPPKVFQSQKPKVEKLVFPEGTKTTDLDEILKSKFKTPSKPLPPLPDPEPEIGDTQFLPLEYFENPTLAEYTLDELMQNPIAYSRYTSNGETTWEKCKVINFNNDNRMFTIQWVFNGKQKNVPRFNLRFEMEDPEKFKARIEDAIRSCQLYQANIRLNARIALMPIDHLPNLDDDAFIRIQEKSGQYEGKYATLKNELENDIKYEFKLMNNRLEFEYDLEHNPMIPNREEFYMLQKHQETPPEYGLVEQTEYDFKGLVAKLLDVHLFGYPSIQEGIFRIYSIFEQSSSIMFLIPGFPEVLTLEDFVTRQYQHLGDTTNGFKNTIRETLEGVIVETKNRKDSIEPPARRREFIQRMAVLCTRMLHTFMLDIVQVTLDLYSKIFEVHLDPKCEEPPQFFIDLFYHDSHSLNFLPPVDTFLDQLMSLLQQMESSVADLPNIKSDKLKVDTSSVTFTDSVEVVRTHREKLNGTLESLFAMLEEFLDQNRYIESILKLDPVEYPYEFDPKSEKPLSEYRKKLDEFKVVGDKVESELKSFYNIGLFRVSCKSFKESALFHINTLTYNFLGHVKKFALEQINELKNEYTDIGRAMSEKPETPEELSALKNYVDNVVETQESRDQKIEKARQCFEFLEEFHFAIESNDFDFLYNTLMMPNKVEQLMEETNRMIAQERIRMIRELRSNQRKLENDTLTASENLTAFTAKYTDLELTVEATDKINEMEKVLKELKARQDLYNSHEQLFEFEPVNCRILTKLFEEFTPLHMLWNLANEWMIASSNWLDQPFPQIKTDTMSQFLHLSSKKLIRLKKDLFNQRIITDKIIVPLTNQIDTFKLRIPLLMKLRHPGIKTKHWEQISDIVGFTVQPSMELTLQGYFDLNLEKFADKISEITSIAAQEYQIESSLDQMDTELQTISFITVQYKDSGHFILQKVDDVLATIDDQLVTTQSLLTSPFIGASKDRALERMQFLKNCHKILDSWVIAQRNWLYLQPIFTGTSIQQKLHKEALDWKQVNKIWSSVMTLTHNHPSFYNVMHRESLLGNLEQCNQYFDSITKGLNVYLENKRLNFPRFFFLSNEELINILSHTKDFNKIQESISKLFEYVNTLTIADESEITHMNDVNGESVKLIQPVDGDTPEIEDWLINFEEEMKATLKESVRDALTSVTTKKKEAWISENPAQVVLISNQIMWTTHVTNCFKNAKIKGLQNLHRKYIEQLDYLTSLIRQSLPKLMRDVVSCMLIAEVHNRDIITGLIDADVTDSNNFNWVKQLRYYWDNETIIVKSINNTFEYSFEYAGNSTRLVITPLTDRCYQTILSAFKQYLSGAPSGPAGTGKTETVRDCAKALGRPCVVYNCSENVTPEQMSQFFAGLSSSGAWSCFDEFNRINIEVLSVIAQQVRTIQDAMRKRTEIFILDHRTLKLSQNAAICITMNPGYAGRTELPDNLKALFRPCAMMVPDYVFICEILLFSGGFKSASQLSTKLVALFNLCTTQLSNMHHYDWGLRAMKTILENAAISKRNEMEKAEEYLLYCAVRDCTSPRLVSNDLPLFKNILTDVFPEVTASNNKDEALVKAIEESCKELGCQPLPFIVSKAIEFFQIQSLRHGVMLVGGSLSGKSTSWRALEMALKKLGGQYAITRTLNPKSITNQELYGRFNPATSEWNDGILSSSIRECAFMEEPCLKWIIVDGPVDSTWIESMNSLLDDNKVLCLPNNERIQIGNYVRIVFEVGDLIHASPATVSRCGMVYYDQVSITWKALYDSWADKYREQYSVIVNYVKILMDQYIPDLIQFLQQDAKLAINVNPNFAVQTLLRMLTVYLQVMRKPEQVIIEGTDDVKQVDPLNQSIFFSQFSGSDSNTIPFIDDEQIPLIFERVFLFCCVWSFGGLLTDESRIIFDNFMKDETEIKQSKCPFPTRLTVFDYYADLSRFSWVVWCDGITGISFTEHKPIDDQMIPINECAGPLFVLRQLCNLHHNAIVLGLDSAKTLIGKTLLDMEFDPEKFDIHYYPLSNCTLPTDLSRYILSFMHKRQGKFGPLPGRHMMFFLDNISSVKTEEFGAQPALELLRQFLDYQGWFNTNNVQFQELQNTSLIGAMSPSSSGGYDISERILRHFCLLHIPKYKTPAYITILNNMMMQRMSKHPQTVKDQIKQVVMATVDVFEQCQATLLPIPSKLHYVFGMKNLISLLKGILLQSTQFYTTDNQFLILWRHEMMREFYDRFNTDFDRSWFNDLLSEMYPKHFKIQWETVHPDNFLMFNSFSDGTQRYKEVKVKPDQVLATCFSTLEEHNRDSSQSIDITLFHEAVEHLSILSRVLMIEKGHAMLVGVKSTGRKSIAKLGLHMASLEPFQITITSNYSFNDWRDDMKNLIKQCGVSDVTTGFIISDVQIVLPQQLEDLSNLISSASIPMLFDSDEIEAIKGEIEQSEIQVDLDSYKMFTERIRKNLHIIFVVSPYGSVFRDVMLSYTTIRSNSIIDWYMPWSKNALESIAQASLGGGSIGSPDVVHSVVSVCVMIHKSVEESSTKFYKETKRFNAVTPSRYFELLSTFHRKLVKKQLVSAQSIHDYETGVEKIRSTRELIEEMSKQLDHDIPVLEKTKKDVEVMLSQLTDQQEEVEKIKKEVQKQSELATTEAEEAEQTNKIAQEQFALAQPLLLEAQEAVQRLDKDSLVNIKKLHAPSAGMKETFEAVCIMFNRAPRKIDGPIPGTKEDDYWPETVSLLNDVQFIKNVTNFKIENIAKEQINKLKRYVPTIKTNRNEKKKAALASFMAVGALYDWVCASFDYWFVYQEILPKKVAAEEASKRLEASQKILAEAKAHLKSVEEKLQSLIDNVEKAKEDEKTLTENVANTQARLLRAQKIMSGLAGESTRWADCAVNLRDSSVFILGDSLLVAGILTYLGAFNPHYRTEMIDQWKKFLTAQGIKFSQNFTIESGLGSETMIRDWILQGLPNDKHSIENALIITQNELSFPLLIDPQLHGTKWLRMMFKDELKVLHFDQSDFVNQLKLSVIAGNPVLIDNVGLTLDHSIDPILSRSIHTLDNKKIIVLNGDNVEYNDNFRLYISTKYPNPKYSPEICSELTLINFTTTQEGLTDLLLNNLIEVEREDLDKKRVQIMEANAENIKKLKETEQEILQIVSNTGSDILDDDNAIETLQRAQKTSAQIEQQMSASEKTEQQISQFKNRFMAVAERAALLYFCISDFSVIDPMYQFSLRWYVPLFRRAIFDAEHPQDHLQTIFSFQKSIANKFYEAVSYSLFSKHKLLFSTLLTIRILTSERKITGAELAFLLQPALTTEENPFPWMPEDSWKQIGSLPSVSSSFQSIIDSMRTSKAQWKKYIGCETPEKMGVPFSGSLSSFQKFMVLKIMHLQRVREGLRLFIEENLGPEFVNPPTLMLSTIFKETDPLSPLIFIINPGIDPQDEIINVAQTMNVEQYLRPYSLGRGQGVGAEELINDAASKGFWVLLQNCHLSLSWMPRLEQIISNLNPQTTHRRFRLCLVTMSSDQFPIGILYQGTKLIYEIPKGVKENVTRIYGMIDPEEYDCVDPNSPEHQLTFHLAFLHAIILERLQFGSIGWNIPYEFNPSDFAISLRHLKIFLSESQSDQIPFTALSYVIGELNYGGRVTDHWDRRTLLALIQKYFSRDIMSSTFTFGSRYNIPAYTAKHHEMMDAFKNWPVITEGTDVCLSENASTLNARNEAMSIFSSIIEVQPTIIANSDSVSEDQFTINFIEGLIGQIPKPFNIVDFKKRTDLSESLNIVLYHEVLQYNELLSTINESLNSMMSGLKGFVIIDDKLQHIIRRLMSNKVPETWLEKSYPSILNLRNYIDDLIERIKFMDSWVRAGPPIIFHLGAFFHPEEFLTYVLQIYARKHTVPFDTLRWITTPVEQTDENPIESAPEEGVYIKSLPLEGAKWEPGRGFLVDCGVNDLQNYLPVMHLIPTQAADTYDMSVTYECPVYRTQNRGTGALDLPNYILSLYLPTPRKPPSHWVLRSVAAFITVS